MSSPTLLPTPNYTHIISQALDYRENQISVVLELTAEGATVPFIARYRKECTGNLDETDIRAIIELQTKEENLYKAKQTAINGIEELGKMTPELMANILAAKTLKEVEELYKPYKSKKKTKAMIAIEKGFQVVADAIKTNNLLIPESLILEYTKSKLLPGQGEIERGLIIQEIIEGAIEIIGAEVSANANLRHSLIAELQKTGDVSASKKSDKMLEKLNAKDTEQIPKFALYFEFHSRINRIKPYQILALNRGENLGILNVKLEKDEMILGSLRAVYRNILNLSSAFIEELELGFKLGYDALWSSVENEIRGELSELGEDDSIKTFQTNLQALLMTRPEYGKTILAIDPGYRAGCKMCVIDTLGNPVVFDKIFLHEMENARAKLAGIFKKHSIDTVVIGNGTGCDETCTLVAELFSGDIFVVNESGASVYSASPVAQEEFPDLDSLDRGTVSIGRRYIDPLSELVKVPVSSIGVGMYQHDVAEKKLDEKLGYVVEDVVNEVGINVNNASIYVLQHISGIDKREAKKIYNHRPYKSREALKKVLSEKAYSLAIGFLRVPESKEPLDNTDIHPDQYPLAKYILENNLTESDFRSHETELRKLYPDVNSDTMKFILRANSELGIEKRTSSTHTKARKKVAMEDVKEGDIFDGVVRNVVAFGAFVDIGLKNDGLVHVSQMANKFVSNPSEIVSVGDRVKVRVTGIDLKTGKIQLSMKEV
ncbi:RNA-binding transcriptional accessory protein [Candidatus Gracilibacteria bacterium CG_4_10_14_0_8_um_filter_38_28]|nr:MAG: RNA-binding transcriptional accessory protein [Candidatus Gracilibacteria bacterium CG_4_10_14_0_8_um_filter_38_28]